MASKETTPYDSGDIIMDYLNNLASCAGDPKQVSFVTWQINNAEEVRIQPYKSDPELKEMIDNYQKHNELEIQNM